MPLPEKREHAQATPGGQCSSSRITPGGEADERITRWRCPVHGLHNGQLCRAEVYVWPRRVLCCEQQSVPPPKQERVFYLPERALAEERAEKEPLARVLEAARIVVREDMGIMDYPEGRDLRDAVRAALGEGQDRG